MTVQSLACPSCGAPVQPAAGPQRCPYCSATITVSAPAAAGGPGRAGGPGGAGGPMREPPMPGALDVVLHGADGRQQVADVLVAVLGRPAPMMQRAISNEPGRVLHIMPPEFAQLQARLQPLGVRLESGPSAGRPVPPAGGPGGHGPGGHGHGRPGGPGRPGGFGGPGRR